MGKHNLDKSESDEGPSKRLKLYESKSDKQAKLDEGEQKVDNSESSKLDSDFIPLPADSPENIKGQSPTLNPGEDISLNQSLTSETSSLSGTVQSTPVIPSHIEPAYADSNTDCIPQVTPVIGGPTPVLVDIGKMNPTRISLREIPENRLTTPADILPPLVYQPPALGEPIPAKGFGYVVGLNQTQPVHIQPL